MDFEVYAQFCESTYHLLVTSVIYYSFQNDVSIVYIHYVDVFISFVGCDWKVSTQVGVKFSFLRCTSVRCSAEKSLILNLSFRYVSKRFFMVDCSPCRLIFRCPIVVLIDFSICLVINPSVRSSHVLRKLILIALISLVFLGLKSVACKYCDSYGLVV